MCVLRVMIQRASSSAVALGNRVAELCSVEPIWVGCALPLRFVQKQWCAVGMCPDNAAYRWELWPATLKHYAPV